MTGFFELTLGGLIGSGIATTLVGAAFLRRNKRVESEIKAHFDEAFRLFESKRAWRQQALHELFGPLFMQFERTRRAFERWDERNPFLEGQVIHRGNQTIRDLLLEKGHLIPPHLMADAAQLIEHYDAWLEEFDRERGAAAQPGAKEFVFVGPKGYPFPKEAERRFKAEFETLQKDLYDL